MARGGLVDQPRKKHKKAAFKYTSGKTNEKRLFEPEFQAPDRMENDPKHRPDPNHQFGASMLVEKRCNFNPTRVSMEEVSNDR